MWIVRVALQRPYTFVVVNNEMMRGQAGASLEESREMVGAHVHQGAELREPKLSPQIVLHVLCDTTESSRR